MTKTRGRLPVAGFSLLEMVVIIAVMGILAAAVTPALVQRVTDTRIESTRDEARTLYEAIVGNPAEGANGGLAFGYVGDMGRLPDAYTELVQKGSQANYTTSTTRSIGMGWRGPYVNDGTSSGDYLTDAFGRQYTGASSGQVKSAGLDGVAGNTDDIVYPPSAPTITGSVLVTVKTTQGQKTVVDPGGYRVDLFYSNSGAEAMVSDTTSPFSFSSIPMGIHAVRVVKTSNPGAGDIVSQDTVVVRPNSTAAIELWF